jgi:hypothetical protein
MTRLSIYCWPMIALTLAPLARAALPPGTRGWQTVPNVIRADGVDSFVLEVETNGPVVGVALDVAPFHFVVPGGQQMQPLRDDGLGSDRVAGDFVYTSEPIRYNPSSVIPFPDNMYHDPYSPAGLSIEDLGSVTIEELGGGTWQFLEAPDVGLLRADIPATEVRELAPNIVASPHLINVRTANHVAQRQLRSEGDAASLGDAISDIYQVVPDAFDFLTLFSTNRIERLQNTASPNFVAGLHYPVQVNFDGTGQSRFDQSAIFGSDGKLLSVNILDAMNRGINSGNATHELVHQWSYYLDPALGLGSNAHPNAYSNIGSLLGSFAWHDNGDGTFTILGEEGSNQATHVSPLEAYLMGLSDGSDVGNVYVYDSASTPPFLKYITDEPITADEIVTTVTLGDIQSLHGVRTPTPESAQRDFSIGFVAESHERLLTATEMTFYDILAEHYTSEVAGGEPDPRVGFNWAPITRFFGHDTTWTSAVPILPALPGDYNGDNVVNAADYTVWRNSRGQTITLPNDSTPGEVNDDDYAVWKAHFGESIGAASGPAVPEPTLWWELIAGVGISVLGCRRRWSLHRSARRERARIGV